MNFNRLLAVIVCFTACLSLHAHQDRIIRLNAGKLEGLPPQYQPASFSITERRLQVGPLSVEIPDCVWSHWGTVKEGDLQFTASWYHDFNVRPPYLSISFKPSPLVRKFKHQLLLNLDTLELISLEQETKEAGGTTRKAIPLTAPCAAAWKVVRKP